jgi:hypothetical protein
VVFGAKPHSKGATAGPHVTPRDYSYGSGAKGGGARVKDMPHGHAYNQNGGRGSQKALSALTYGVPCDLEPGDLGG